jgi:hypothetical protein
MTLTTNDGRCYCSSTVPLAINSGLSWHNMFMKFLTGVPSLRTLLHKSNQSISSPLSFTFFPLLSALQLFPPFYSAVRRPSLTTIQRLALDCTSCQGGGVKSCTHLILLRLSGGVIKELKADGKPTHHTSDVRNLV